MSKIEVNTIEPQCGTTLTLGGSGDTVALGSGASQTGFGRTGTVNWDTASIKTTGFTAVSGNGYFCNTSGGAFTATLPANPTAGDIVAFSDYTRSFATYNLTIGRNSKPIGGVAADGGLDADGQSATFVFVDDTEGWININETQTSQTGIPPFISATGGTITCSGNDKIHTFTGPGTFTVCKIATCCAAVNNLVSYMVVAGGGGSGAYAGGGGGAGGFRELKSPSTPYTASPLDGYPNAPNRITVTATDYPIVVGGGGTGNPTGDPGGAGTRGNDASFSSITSAGGGAGAGGPAPTTPLGPGGSGGGGSEGGAGGSGDTPPTTPAQGFTGGTGSGPGPQNDHYEEGGAGGGATTVGGNGTHAGSPTATGGTGATTHISATPTAYAGGGGGGRGALSPGGGAPSGGAGGGGNGAFSTTENTVGTANTGGGGGGGSAGPAPSTIWAGANGGDGIVVIRYKFQ